MSRKTYRVKLDLLGNNKPSIYRTDGIPTHCCSFQTDYFCWEKNTKFNSYNGWSGYVSKSSILKGLESYDPDNLREQLVGISALKQQQLNTKGG